MPFKDTAAGCNIEGSVELDGTGVYANSHLAPASGASVGAFSFFHGCRSPSSRRDKEGLV